MLGFVERGIIRLGFIGFRVFRVPLKGSIRMLQGCCVFFPRVFVGRRVYVGFWLGLGFRVFGGGLGGQGFGAYRARCMKIQLQDVTLRNARFACQMIAGCTADAARVLRLGS